MVVLVTKLGINLVPTLPPSQLRPLAQAADRAGLDGPKSVAQAARLGDGSCWLARSPGTISSRHCEAIAVRATAEQLPRGRSAFHGSSS